MPHLPAAHERPVLAACLREGIEWERDLADCSEPDANRPTPAETEDAPPPTARLSLARRVQANHIYLVHGKTQGRDAWYYLLVNRKAAIVFEKETRRTTFDLVMFTVWLR